MKSRWTLILITMLVVAACQQAPDERQLPTLAVLPSLTPTDDIAASPTIADSPTPAPAATLEASATAIPTTATLLPIDEPSPLPQATAILPTLPPAGEPGEVRLSTLTPVPPGDNAPLRTTPQVMADLVIAEREFQIALNAALESLAEIQSADINFVAEGIDVTLTALGGQAFITGNVVIAINVSGTFATFSLASIEVNAQEAPEAYEEVVASKLFPAVIETLDTMLTERLGAGHDLENIIMAAGEMRVFLLIPER